MVRCFGKAAVLIFLGMTSCQRPDNVPPALNISYPQSGAEVYGPQTEIRVAATDNDKMGDVAIFADDVSLGPSEGVNFYRCQWFTDWFDDGYSHLIYAEGEDAGGNDAVTPPVYVLVSNIPSDHESVRILAGDNGLYNLNWSSRDSTDHYRVLILDGQTPPDTLSVYETNQTGWNGAPLPSGQLCIVRVYDAENILRPLASRTFSSDSTFLYVAQRADNLPSLYHQSAESRYIRRITRASWVRSAVSEPEQDRIWLVHGGGIDSMRADGSNRGAFKTGSYTGLSRNAQDGRLLSITENTARIISHDGSAVQIPVRGIHFSAVWDSEGDILLTAIPSRENLVNIYAVSSETLDYNRISSGDIGEDCALPMRFSGSDQVYFTAGSRLYVSPFDGGGALIMKTFGGDIVSGAAHPDGETLCLSVRRKGLYSTDTYYEMIRYNIKTDVTEILFESSTDPKPVISPGGTAMACTRNGSLVIWNFSTSDYRVRGTVGGGVSWF